MARPPSHKPAARRNHRGNKADLPTKVCAGCGQPFSWRKRWARVWEEVRYCSEGCRGRARSRRQPIDPAKRKTGRQMVHQAEIWE